MNQNDGFRYLHIGLPEIILRKKMAGDLQGAIEEIEQQLKKPTLTPGMKACLEANREMLRRLPSDYPFSKKEAIAFAQKNVSDFSEEEFDLLEKQKRILWIFVNGEKRYFDRFVEVLCKTDAAFAKRAGETGVPRNEQYFWEAIKEMEKNGKVQKYFRCKSSVQLKEECFEKGKKVRAYLPIPCACDSQSEIRLEKIFPEPTMISAEDAPQRVVFWEEQMEENHPFTVEFSYVRTAAEKTVMAKENKAEEGDLKKFTEEDLPHIAFTPYIRELTRELTKDLKTPMEKAQAVYDFVTKNVRYSFMPAYFSMENIADNCAKNLYGDCGVQTLLFITLCRCAGIPAKWESGWAAEPGFCGAHDWARIYVEPYGWLYADASYGGDAFARGDEKRRTHYFGNLDPYRMTANTAFQADYQVPKNGWRADPYDNQVGEMEIEGRGLEYAEFIRRKEVEICEDFFETT